MGMFDKFPYRNTRDLNLNWIIKKIIYLEGIIGAAVSDVAEFLSKKGGKMEGAIDMQNNRIFNVPTPAGDTDVTSKKYVDDKAGNYLPLAGGTMTGAVNMGGNKIANVATPEADADVATKKYVDDHSGGVSGDYLPLAGGTMTGAVNMGGNKITSVADPEAAQDVATKKYVDDHSGGGVGGDYLPLAGGTMTGAINMSGNKITSVADPEAAQDVATKKYVDDHSGGGINSVTYIKTQYTLCMPIATFASNAAKAMLWLPFVLSSNYSHDIVASKLIVTDGSQNYTIKKLETEASGNALEIRVFVDGTFAADRRLNIKIKDNITINK